MHLEDNNQLYPSFNNFHNFLKNNISELNKYFGDEYKDLLEMVNSFLYLTKDYCKGNKYGNILNFAYGNNFLEEPVTFFTFKNGEIGDELLPIATLMAATALNLKIQSNNKNCISTMFIIDNTLDLFLKTGRGHDINYLVRMARKLRAEYTFASNRLSDLIRPPILNSIICTNSETNIIINDNSDPEGLDEIIKIGCGIIAEDKEAIQKMDIQQGWIVGSKVNRDQNIFNLNNVKFCLERYMA